ncbi:MAG TPA: hypothetical protein VGO60_05680 [Iamia sp.]|jgi:hypothetical protein|nr:hypothetical protein [Iamia sp.]
MRTPLTLRPRRAALVLAAGALLATGATGCEPAEPGVFTVVTSAVGADAVPGDGLCVTATDECSLQAAVEESNALGTRTEITVPANVPVPAADLEVTGAITLLSGGRQMQSLGLVSWTVAQGAELSVTDASLGPVVVEGTFLARRVVLGGGLADPIAGVDALVQVGPTGQALLSNAYGVSVGAPLVINAGVLSIHGTTVDPAADPGPATITTETGGQTRLSATAFLGGAGAVDVCAGEAPTSYGYNLASDTTCDLFMTGDHQDFDETATLPSGVDDARLDAVPLGTLHCGAGWSDDLTSGSEIPARPADGNADSVKACDAGAREVGLGA